MLTVMMKGTTLIISRRKGILRICSQMFPFKEKEQILKNNKLHVRVGLHIVLMKSTCDIPMPHMESLPLAEFWEDRSSRI